MSLEFLGILAALACHIAIYLYSDSRERKKRLAWGIGLVLLSVVLFFVGLFVGLSGQSSTKSLALTLINAPIYVPLLSFLIYWPKIKPADDD